MPIIRSQFTFEKNRLEFTQIPNNWLRDQRLSLRSIGLLAQLLSHKPGWSLTVASLAKINNCGVHSITVAIQELEDAGYLSKSQQKDDKGRFDKVLWFTQDPNDPVSDYPLSDIPTSDSPTSDNQTLKNTKTKNTNVKNTKHEQFDLFWSQYPRRVGKASARKAFMLVVDDYGDDILAGVQRLAGDPNLPPTEFIPYPATWLNREGWDDEPYPKREQKPWEKPAELPTVDWRKWYCDRDDHTFCDHETKEK